MRTKERASPVSPFVFDVRHSFRSLIRHPSLSVAMFLVLTFGIAANTTLFSVMQEVLLRPLPYSDPGKLVIAWERDPSLAEPWTSRAFPSWRILEQWRLRNHSFTGLEAFRPISY